MSGDYRDIVIATFADNEAALLDRVVDLTADCDAYQLLAQQLLHALHAVMLERDLLRDQRVLDRRRAREQWRAA